MVAGEIASRLLQEERSFSYLLTALAAIVGSQFVLAHVSSAGHYLGQRPWLILAVGHVALWFPINNVIIWADIGACASYLRRVLVPKLEAISSTHQYIAPAAYYVLNAKMVDQNISAPYKGPFSWESYRASYFYENRRIAAILMPLWVFRTLLLFAPSLALAASYIIVRQGSSQLISWGEVGLLSTLVVFYMLITLALLSVSNLPRTHLRSKMKK